MRTIFLFFLFFFISASVFASITDCPRFCTDDFRPVCGINKMGQKETFANNCALEMKKCLEDRKLKKFSDGALFFFISGTVFANRANCPTFCPANYAPICAINKSGQRVTFANNCALESKKCLDDKKLKKISDGACEHTHG